MNVNGNVVFSGTSAELDEMLDEAERKEKEINPQDD